MSASKLSVALALAPAWFALGCGNDIAPPRPPGPGDTEVDPPSVYVAKVKNILVGLPPTDDEVAAVTDDPAALGGLIDGWMQLPEYQDKMQVFFELAFQQTQIDQNDFIDMIPPRGIGNGRGVPLLVANIRESFARTALQLVAEGRPFTETFTTKRVMMTTALANFYAYLDARRVDNAGAINDQFARANPGLNITLEAAQGPIPIAQSANPASPNYMHFYQPVLPNEMNYPNPECNGLDPISFPANALNLETMLYGEVAAHRTAAGVQCTVRANGDPQLTPSDFTDWHMVRIRPPAGAEPTTPFFDLGALRTGAELVIGTPHPGFFTTPAFFANWSTNASNQMRVTLNQALIVATGAQTDLADPSIPDSTPGLDADHAPPGSSCFGCHQRLDPTRSILSATYSWFYYPQTDPALKAEKGLFAFQGVIAPMSNIDDFARLLADHPLVSTAWAQKLCYYASSAPCDPADPELARVVEAFEASSRNWNVMIRELMSSPMITNASPTTTSAARGAVVSVSRRDHLCAALNNRLGFVDVCELDKNLIKRGKPSTISLIVSGLPSDGYGRGSTEPVLPNEATLFYRAAVENVCSLVSQMVIDGKPDPNQPGAKHWSSSDPDGTIHDLVATVMALTSSDPRSTAATDILKAHFTAASQSGAATDALRSTFIAACLSPSFLGIGM